MTTNALNVRVNVSMNINGIGQRMKIARLLHGTSTKKLSQAAGRHQRTIQRYEAGAVAFPEVGVLFAIADYLEISAYWLLSGIGKPCEDAERAEAIYGMLAELNDRTEPVMRAYQHRV